MSNYKINFYKESGKEVDNNTLHCLCHSCSVKCYIDLELIDVAGSWDECEVCFAQNVPSWPSGYLTTDEHSDVPWQPLRKWEF